MPAPSSEALLSRLELFGMRLGLDRIRRLLAAFGDPHLAVPVVLVGGTNGKGSTAALLAAMGRAAGCRTGLYTSPHLESVTERLTVDGCEIDDSRLAGYLQAAVERAGDLGEEPPTYFEALTVAAFLWFRDRETDLSVLEVGLGGRFDATNVSEPVLSLITSIDFDHEAHLGDSLASIAFEKSGILRRDRPAVAWAGSPEVARVLRERAFETGALLELADPLRIRASTAAGACPQRARLRTARGAYALELHLPGRHQLRNLTVAVRAAERLAESGWAAMGEAAITAGTAACRWPGRLEWITLDDDRRVLLDAAHNAAGIEALLGFLDRSGERPDLLFGALAEKSIDVQLKQLATRVHSVVLTRPASRRSADPEHWAPYFGGLSVRFEADLERALHTALAGCESCLLVCGSIYLIGRVRSLLLQGSPRASTP